MTWFCSSAAPSVLDRRWGIEQLGQPTVEPGLYATTHRVGFSDYALARAPLAPSYTQPRSPLLVACEQLFSNGAGFAPVEILSLSPDILRLLEQPGVDQTIKAKLEDPCTYARIVKTLRYHRDNKHTIDDALVALREIKDLFLNAGLISFAAFPAFYGDIITKSVRDACVRSESRSNAADLASRARFSAATAPPLLSEEAFYLLRSQDMRILSGYFAFEYLSALYLFFTDPNAAQRRNPGWHHAFRYNLSASPDPVIAGLASVLNHIRGDLGLDFGKALIASQMARDPSAYPNRQAAAQAIMADPYVRVYRNSLTRLAYDRLVQQGKDDPAIRDLINDHFYINHLLALLIPQLIALFRKWQDPLAYLFDFFNVLGAGKPVELTAAYITQQRADTVMTALAYVQAESLADSDNRQEAHDKVLATINTSTVSTVSLLLDQHAIDLPVAHDLDITAERIDYLQLLSAWLPMLGHLPLQKMATSLIEQLNGRVDGLKFEQRSNVQKVITFPWNGKSIVVLDNTDEATYAVSIAQDSQVLLTVTLDSVTDADGFYSVTVVAQGKRYPLLVRPDDYFPERKLLIKVPDNHTYKSDVVYSLRLDGAQLIIGERDLRKEPIKLPGAYYTVDVDPPLFIINLKFPAADD